MLSKLTLAELNALTDLALDWRNHARPEQLDPGWDPWIVLYQTGRGWGKSRTILEIARGRIDRGEWRTVLAAAPTAGDVGLMLNGSDDAPGLLNLWPQHRAARYTQAQDDPRVICWNGAIIRLRSAQRPDRFRGPNNDGIIADEIDSWSPEKVTASEAFSVLEMTVRGKRPLQILASSTPKRGGLVGELAKRDECMVVRGRMRENIANLSKRFVNILQGKYGGTRLGRQELEGELLEDVEGSLITPSMIEAGRVQNAPELERIVVGVDPSGSQGGDLQGIVVCGRGGNSHGYVLADRSCSERPEGWARRAVEAYFEFDADSIVVERNYGGDMAKAVINQAARQYQGGVVPVLEVSASRAKHIRFEPVSLMVEQGRIHFKGRMPLLEEEACGFTAEGWEGMGSPDRADAMVWAFAHLFPPRPGLGWGDLYGEDNAAAA